LDADMPLVPEPSAAFSGGLDGMAATAAGGAADHDFVRELRCYCREIFDLADITVRVLFQADSSNMGVTEWAEIGRVIVSSWSEFDAFVIVHGTDTLAYCSSFLSLTMSSPSKPIVLTGSQRPLRELRSDARMNLIDAVQLAGLCYPGVFVAFDSDVFLGSRVAKLSNLELGAFQSPNFPKIGHFGVEVELNTVLLAEISDRESPPEFDPRASDCIVVLAIAPGAPLNSDIRKSVLTHAKGIVIEGFGLGHGPTRLADWILLCEEALVLEIPVLMVTPCRRGRVDMNLYPVGRAFRDRGVMNSADMTRECAAIKMMMMIGRKIAFCDRHVFMATPLGRESNAPALMSHQQHQQDPKRAGGPKR
jgi:L-asparaginase